MITLRPYQLDQVEALRDGFRAGVNRQLLCSPTGSGKGVVFSYMTHEAAKKGLRVMVLAHRSEILDQISDNLANFDVPIGHIRAGIDPDGSKPVQIASVQTLVRRFSETTVPDLVIVDECHHSSASSWASVFDWSKEARFVGVTATPERLDGRGLGEFYEKMVMGPSVAWLISNGFLKQPVYYAPEKTVDLSQVSKVAGDYSKSGLDAVVNTAAINGDAVEHYKKLGRNLPAVAFCVNLKHAASVSESFCAAGIPAEVIEGKVEASERRAMKARLASGETRVLVSCELVSEGFDLPAVGCAIKLRPTMSLALNLQQDGRALRPSLGHTEAVILDCVGNWERHGLAHWDRQWSLEGHAAKKRDEEQVIETRQCTGCFCVYQGTECPQCHLVRESKLRLIKQREGELKLIEAQQLLEKRDRKMEEWKCRTYEDWKKLGQQRGNKPGWAWFRYSNSRHFAQKRKQPELV